MSPEIQQNEFGGDADHKIERLIFYATRHGMLLSRFGSDLDDVRQRLRGLEEDRQRSDIAAARREEQDKVMVAKLQELTTMVTAMRGVLNKAISVIAIAVLMAVVKWVLSGGLTV